MTVVTTEAVELALSTPTKTVKERRVHLEWLLREVESDYSRHVNSREVVRLSISHSTTSKAFNTTLSRVVLSDVLDGDGNKIGGSEKFTLFAGVSLGKVPCARYSAKRLEEATAATLERLYELVDEGNEKVLSYYDKTAVIG